MKRRICYHEIYVVFLLEISLALCFNLTILHTNDVHGRIEETDKTGFVCDPEITACFGGMARMATVIKQVRKKQENVVLLDGGDRFTGTIWTEVYKGNATSTFFNGLNYTAITLGNHDFDYGVKTLLHFLDKTKCPVVVSNMNTSQESLWPDNKQLVKNSLVVDISGEKVGFVGYITTETSRTSSPGENIKFLPILTSVQGSVDELKSKGIKKIVAVGHAGFDVDKEIARQVVGVDVVVGGHSNTFLYSGDPPSTDKAKGPYPFIIHPDHNKNLSVLVVQAYYYTKYLGNLQVTFNDDGEVTSWSGNPLLLDSTVAKDSNVYDMIEKMKVLVDEKGNEKIGQINVNVPTAELLALAMVYYYRSYNARIAMFHHGSVIMNLATDKQGVVLYKDLFQSFPYHNTVDMVELSGADLKSSIKASPSGFLQRQGFRVTYSDGDVEDIKVAKNADCSADDCFVPLNTTQTYKVVSTSYFIAVSNKIIAAKGKNRIRGESVWTVLVEYFKAKYPVKKNDVNGSGKLIHDYIVFVLIVLANFCL